MVRTDSRRGPYVKGNSLGNISGLFVEWVGDWRLGANRSIRVTVRVQDRDDPTKELALQRTLFPPTD